MLQQPAKVYFPIRIDEAALDGDPRLYDETFDESTDRGALAACSEVEDEANMAFEALLDGKPLKFLDQPGLADAGFAADMQGEATPRLEARLQGTCQLRQFGLPAHESCPYDALG